MPTDTIASRPSVQAARSFALRGVAWSVGLFGVLRLGWVDAHVVLPLTGLQAAVAQSVFGRGTLPVAVTSACSAADAVALCVAAIFAYPAAWRTRLLGAAGGVALILAVNTVRIGTLMRAAGAPLWFHALHVFLWPALLVLAIGAYVFVWMRAADMRPARSIVSPPLPALESAQPGRLAAGRFVALTAALLVVFVAASPLYLESGVLLAVAAFVARVAAVLLRGVGLHAVASGNMLTTSRGGFIVTQECISTPVIVVYFAAVCTYATAWTARAAALLAAGPLFVALGVARLLVVALPPSLIGAPLFAVHAFYQFVLAAVIVCAAAVWRHGPSVRAWRRACFGAAAGSAVGYLFAFAYSPAVAAASAAGIVFADPQGAIALLPSFQVGLYTAVFIAASNPVRWQPFTGGLAMLGLSQVAVFATLRFAVLSTGWLPHVREIRAWALAAPLAVVAALVTYDHPRR